MVEVFEDYRKQLGTVMKLKGKEELRQMENMEVDTVDQLPADRIANLSNFRGIQFKQLSQNSLVEQIL